MNEGSTTSVPRGEFTYENLDALVEGAVYRAIASCDVENYLGALEVRAILAAEHEAGRIKGAC